MKCCMPKVVVCVTIIVFLSMGCSFTYKEWDKVKDSDDIETLEKFKNENSKSEFGRKAEIRIWEITSERDGITDYETFMSKYPDSEYYKLARTRHSELCLNAILERNEIEAIMKIALKSEDTSFRNQARKKIKEIIDTRGKILPEDDIKSFEKGFSDIISQMKMHGISSMASETFMSYGNDKDIPSFVIKDYIAMGDLEIVHCGNLLVKTKNDANENEYGEICYFEGKIYRIDHP